MGSRDSQAPRLGNPHTERIPRRVGNIYAPMLDGRQSLRPRLVANLLRHHASLLAQFRDFATLTVRRFRSVPPRSLGPGEVISSMREDGATGTTMQSSNPLLASAAPASKRRCSPPNAESY